MEYIFIFFANKGGYSLFGAEWGGLDPPPQLPPRAETVMLV